MANLTGTIAVEDKNLDLNKKIAGLPLALRTVLSLEKAGYKKLKIAAPNQDKLKNILQKRNLDLEITYVENPENDVIFPMGRLYHPQKVEQFRLGKLTKLEDAVLYDLSTPQGFKEANNYLWSTLKKPIENDGVVAYYLGRPISRLLSKLFINLPITPNQVTIFSLLAALAGSVLVSQPQTVILGAVLYWVSFVFDCVDGEIARLKFQGSRWGQWLDTIADDISTTAFTVGLAFLAGRTFASQTLVAASLVSAGLYEFSAILIYITLARMNVVDTAQYPFFFLGEGGAATEEKGFFTYIAYLFRRDVILFIHLILAFFSLFKIMLAIQLVLNFGMALLTFVDKIVKFFSPAD